VSDAGVELVAGHEALVGEIPVRRVLPRRPRRTVGAWCFADLMGPSPVTEDRGIDIGPHPHTGLQTVTWLVEGEVLHRDSLGIEQLIRPGQLNLMTAGHGVSHSEEASPRYRGALSGIQLWVAQPEATRHGPPAFEHHAELPRLDLGPSTATVLVGDLAGTASPARRDTDHVGVDLVLGPGITEVPLVPDHEHAVVVLDGEVAVAGTVAAAGVLAHLGTGRDELALAAATPARVVLLGGVPFPEELVMWWNFVARSRDEIDESCRSWADDDGRFGTVASPLARIPAPARPWA